MSRITKKTWGNKSSVLVVVCRSWRNGSLDIVWEMTRPQRVDSFLSMTSTQLPWTTGVNLNYLMSRKELRWFRGCFEIAMFWSANNWSNKSKTLKYQKELNNDPSSHRLMSIYREEAVVFLKHPLEKCFLSTTCIVTSLLTH